MDHYFSAKPTTEHNETKIFYDYEGKEYSFLTSSSVFSREHIDIGTQILLKYCAATGSVLDLGCGYGVVGIAVSSQASKVTFSDVNERAIMLTKKNCKLNKIKGEVILSDGFASISQTFDTILLNPPQHAGKDVCMRLISESFSHLNAAGSLQIVCRTNKGGKSLSSHMQSVFGNVEVIGKKSGFSVYKSVKS